MDSLTEIIKEYVMNESPKYNKQERTDDYAKYNVKTIIVGYGKTGI